MARLLNAKATRWCIVSKTFAYESKANRRALEAREWRREMIEDQGGQLLCVCTMAEHCGCDRPEAMIIVTYCDESVVSDSPHGGGDVPLDP